MFKFYALVCFQIAHCRKTNNVALKCYLIEYMVAVLFINLLLAIEDMKIFRKDQFIHAIALLRNPILLLKISKMSQFTLFYFLLHNLRQRYPVGYNYGCGCGDETCNSCSYTHHEHGFYPPHGHCHVLDTDQCQVLSINQHLIRFFPGNCLTHL